MISTVRLLFFSRNSRFPDFGTHTGPNVEPIDVLASAVTYVTPS